MYESVEFSLEIRLNGDAIERPATSALRIFTSSSFGSLIKIKIPLCGAQSSGRDGAVIKKNYNFIT